MRPLSDTLFTTAPHWEWLIVLYFFFGGLAAGCFVFSATLDLFGAPIDRKLARLGYLIALPALVLCPPLLILDLSRPERFWHMLFQNHTGVPMLKVYSPISLGAWALALFGIFVTIAFVGALAEESTSPSFRRLEFLRRGAIAKINAVLGGLTGFFVAGYTGVLLSVTNRPIWADTPWLGAVFLLSAASTSGALMVWLGRRSAHPSSIGWLARLETWITVLELIAVVILLITLGPMAKFFGSGWGIILALVMIFGLLVPVLLHFRPRTFGASAMATAAVLALIGGFGVRAVLILSAGAA